MTEPYQPKPVLSPAPGVRLFTCRYQRFDSAMGLAVRTTVGRPRFPLRYELAGFIRELAPAAQMLRWDQDPFRIAYHARLARIGVPGIRQLAQAIADEHGNPRVVLLCFDDLSKPGMWCHRRMFADWWTTHTGEQVPELAEPPNPGLF